MGLGLACPVDDWVFTIGFWGVAWGRPFLFLHACAWWSIAYTDARSPAGGAFFLLRQKEAKRRLRGLRPLRTPKVKVQ